MNLENSLFKVTPGNINTTVIAPTSKSYSNRALILGALKGNNFTVTNISESTDVKNTLKSFTSIGIKFKYLENKVVFLNSFPACELNTSDDIIDLYTGDGGTTNRFLIALLSRGKKLYRLLPSEKMSERPIEDFLLPLRKLGVKIETSIPGVWLTIQGPANDSYSDLLEINCSKSTQFASAMLLAFSETSIKFILQNVIASEKYIKMTQNILLETKYNVPVDFSSMSYAIALGLVNGRVLVSNCKSVDQFQADSIFIELAKSIGGYLDISNDGLLITSQNILTPFTVDGSSCPDLIPTLAFLASKIKGESKLLNLQILEHKESNRLIEILKLLRLFRVDHSFCQDTHSITITGSDKLAPFVELTPPRDHRIVMTAYLFMKANSGGVLGNSDCVAKSYPNFFNDFI
jgi:3-phosphoshikimate 1-carboxyvinyltransferase